MNHKLLILLGLTLTFQSSVQGRNLMEKKTPHPKILVIYHSETGNTKKLASAFVRGVNQQPGVLAVSKNISKAFNTEKDELAHIDDLVKYDAIVLGSPVYFGGMSGQLKSFLDQSIKFWQTKDLKNVPTTFFLSCSSGAGVDSTIDGFESFFKSHQTLKIDHQYLFSKNEYKETEAFKHGQSFAQKVKEVLHADNYELPPAPKAVGNYEVYKTSNNMVYINQIAIKGGKIINPGKIGETVTMDQARIASKQTALNILSILKKAAGGTFDNVKQTVQLSGYFNTVENFSEHSTLMNEATNTLIEVLGVKGKHARAALGSTSLPLNSSVEIKAIFELK